MEGVPFSSPFKNETTQAQRLNDSPKNTRLVKTGSIKTASRQEEELGDMEPTVRSTWLWEPASLCRRACLSSPMGHYQETWLLGPACLADLTGSGPRPSEPPRFYTEVLILLLPSSCSLFQGLHPSPRLLQRAHVRHSFPESTAGLGHVQCPAWVPFPAPRPWGSPLPSPALTSPPINGALGQILKHHSRLAAVWRRRQAGWPGGRWAWLPSPALLPVSAGVLGKCLSFSGPRFPPVPEGKWR